MLKLLVYASCLLAMVTTLEAVPSYTTKYDNINLEEILTNDRLFISYYNCIMEKPDAKCTPDAAELKKVLPDAIKTECSSCNEKQKEGAKLVLKHLHDNRKAEWEEVLKKFDPDSTFREKYKDQARALFNTTA